MPVINNLSMHKLHEKTRWDFGPNGNRELVVA